MQKHRQYLKGSDYPPLLSRPLLEYCTQFFDPTVQDIDKLKQVQWVASKMIRNRFDLIPYEGRLRKLAFFHFREDFMGT